MDMDESGGAAGEPAEVQLAQAIAAGPRHVTDAARIVGADAQGKTMILRRRQQQLHVPTRQPKVPAVSRRAGTGGATVACGFGCAQSKADQRRARHHLHARRRHAARVDPSDQTTALGPQWMIAGRSIRRRRDCRPRAEHRRVHQPYTPCTSRGSRTGRQWNTWPITCRMKAALRRSNRRKFKWRVQSQPGPRKLPTRPASWVSMRRAAGSSLREGNNDFICQPGKPQFVAQPATCYTINSKPRITYMLAGATQRSITDPDDKTSTPLAIGPHWIPNHESCRSPTATRGPTSCGREPARPTCTSWGGRRRRAVWRSGYCRCLGAHPWIYVSCWAVQRLKLQLSADADQAQPETAGHLYVDLTK